MTAAASKSKSHRLLLTLIISLFAALALPAAAGAAITVNDTNTADPGPPGATCATPDFSTIQGAINAASANATILVCTGTYSNGAAGEPAALIPPGKPGLDLIGARAGQDARTRPSALESLISDPEGGIVVRSNDATIDGFDIRDADNTYFAGIWLEEGTSNHRVINNIVRDNGEGLALGNGSAGQTVVRFNFFDANNEVFGNGVSADLGPTQNVLIDRNRFRDQASSGVNFQSTSPVTGFNKDVQIVNNQFENTSPDDTFNENSIVLLSTQNAVIQGNTFSNNASNGVTLLGANQNVSVVGNTISGAGFSAVRIKACSASECGTQWDPNTNVSITGNSLTGTHEVGNDGAGIKIAQDGYAGVLQAHFNRIAGNDRGIELNDSGESVDAENNWWGCNAGPGAAGCDSVVTLGPVDFNPWLVLGLSASPSTVPTGGTSTVTASLAQNSAALTPGGNNFPAGVPIGLSATFGTIASSVATASPNATSVFHAGSNPGTASIFAALDNQSVSTPVQITSAALAQRPSTRCQHTKNGDSGHDFLAGTSEGDRLKGKGGDDTLRGKAGDDCLSGGTENDRLNGGSGEDLLKGGAGDDTINAKDGEPDRVRCGFGNDRATVDSVDTVHDCETVG
jgi:parallel beta-helix repeat protein